MISTKDIYNVLSALSPLYFSLLLAYAAVRRWNLFTEEQCAGINRLVAIFSIPFYIFDFISSHDPYSITLKFVLSDILQKSMILCCLFLWNAFRIESSLDWVATLFSLSSLPNTLIIGVPLLTAMYGDSSGALMVQLVLLQTALWNNLVLLILEFRAAKMSHQLDSGNHQELSSQVSGVNDGKINRTNSPNLVGNPEVSPCNATIKPVAFIVMKKMLKSLNIWASVLAIIWALISYKWNLRLPKIINNPIDVVSGTSLALSMFSLGLFMAYQDKVVSCGKKMACAAMLTRFLLAPLVAGIVSAAVGLRGDLLRISVVQAALPQGIVSFVYAKEYNVHAQLISTSVILSMIFSVPVTIVYYIVLGV